MNRNTPAISSPPVDLERRYQAARQFSEELCQPLETEDFVIQSMPDVSPTRWHLAHTTWFFETFVLAPSVKGYVPVDTAYEYLFNSYYNTVGRQFPRPDRGLLSRPTVRDVFAYRRAVDESMQELLGREQGPESVSVIELGIQHEQQHQELMLTDLKHVFAQNPLFPVYRPLPSNGANVPATSAGWHPMTGGMVGIGAEGSGFAYDNEFPRFPMYLRPFEIRDRLVTNGEYRQFIEDGGYCRPEWWLSQGWSTVAAQHWQAPIYWYKQEDAWHEFTLGGLRPLVDERPVTHLSYFEADAFARWSEARLPTEFEWEVAACELPVAGNFVDSRQFHPQPCRASPTGLRQMYGDVWEWTASAYSPYPGYRPATGALGEYNGKFMCNQFVLRGGSCASSRDHLRPTYRNFFPPEARWQFSGLRLARDATL